MIKLNYESPELDIRWFEPEEIITASIEFQPIPGDGIVDDDEW